MLKMRLSKLQIWAKAITLVKQVHIITRKFPREEIYGITSQIRKAAVSIPSNIAEGSQRTSDKDFANFILIAKGSLAEIQTQLLLSKEFGYLPEADWVSVEKNIEELHRMLHSFHSKLVARSSKLL